jgi:hypothetical protein
MQIHNKIQENKWPDHKFFILDDSHPLPVGGLKKIHQIW